MPSDKLLNTSLHPIAIVPSRGNKIDNSKASRNLRDSGSGASDSDAFLRKARALFGPKHLDASQQEFPEIDDSASSLESVEAAPPPASLPAEVAAEHAPAPMSDLIATSVPASEPFIPSALRPVTSIPLDPSYITRNGSEAAIRIFAASRGLDLRSFLSILALCVLLSVVCLAFGIVVGRGVATRSTECDGIPRRQCRRDPPSRLLRKDKTARSQIEQISSAVIAGAESTSRLGRRPADHMKRPPIEELQHHSRMTPLPLHSRARPMLPLRTQRLQGLQESIRDRERALSHRRLQQPRVPQAHIPPRRLPHPGSIRRRSAIAASFGSIGGRLFDLSRRANLSEGCTARRRRGHGENPCNGGTGRVGEKFESGQWPGICSRPPQSRRLSTGGIYPRSAMENQSKQMQTSASNFTCLAKSRAKDFPRIRSRLFGIQVRINTCTLVTRSSDESVQ